MTEEDIKYMVNRFLAWVVPVDFDPDGGVSFIPPQPPHWPSGTNLLTYTQANMMVRYMVEGMPVAEKQPVIDTKPDDLAHGPEVPHHRFSTFHTAGDYAYARGLEINPQHLPVALDAMQKSGWALLAIFGQTDSKHVGFIFERCIHEVKLPTVEQNPEFAEAIQLYLDGKPLADMMVCGADGRGRGLEP